jgi:hypothetical protein
MRNLLDDPFHVYTDGQLIPYVGPCQTCYLILSNNEANDPGFGRSVPPFPLHGSPSPSRHQRLHMIMPLNVDNSG